MSRERLSYDVTLVGVIKDLRPSRKHRGESVLHRLVEYEEIIAPINWNIRLVPLQEIEAGFS